MTEAHKWMTYYGISFLKKAGIKKGDIIFDCCCGEGNYTIPAARIVGRDGLVYAMDMNKDKIKNLKDKSDLRNLKNIKIIEEEFKKVIPLAGKSIDIVFLYDIFWYFSIDDNRLPLLLNEAHRILKDDCIISVYPEHIDRDKLKQLIIESDFVLEKEISSLLIHDNSLTRGIIWNFKKL
jgi:ubiquinone/menaquinone biosynthesis C-methylase UbiE